MIAAPAETPRDGERRGRLVLWVLLVLGVLATLLLATVFRAPGPEGNPVDIELARDESGFAAALTRGWRENRQAWCGLGADHAPVGSFFGTLRCHLFVDSIAFVPAYAGLLVFFTLLLGRLLAIPSALFIHLLCVPAVAAALFDVAENGMTVVAAEDFMKGLLADATVRDVRLASLCKWSLVAMAFALLAALCWRATRAVHSRGGSPWPLRVAAASAALCAVILVVALATSMYSALAPGMIFAIVALALLAAWRLRAFPAMETGI